MKISDRERQLPESGFANILKQAVEDPSVISLGPGEPDFSTPKHIVAAAKKALTNGFTHYSPIEGRKELLEAIAKKYKKEYKVDIDPSTEVTVGNGSTESLFMALTALIDPGEQALVPDPTFITYEPVIELLNGYPISIPLTIENKFELTAEALENAITDPKKTRALIMCSPSNPTGIVLPKKRLEEIADVVIEHDLTVIMDEAYEKFVYNTKFTPFIALNGMRDHVVSIQSFSKTYAMPGFRLGYAVGPEPIVTAINRLHLITSLTANTASQIAGVTALNGSQKCVKDMQRSYAKRRTMVVRALSKMPGIEFVEPNGAFYAFPKISGLGLSSKDFTDGLLKEQKVLVVPGTEFGRYGEGFVRLSYATAPEKIEIALKRMHKYCEQFV